MDAATDLAVDVRGVVNRFGRQLVHDGLDMQVRRGEVFGILGGSGSGKSVLLRTILGLRRPQAGSVQVEGVDMAHLSGKPLRAAKARYGVTFQHGALFSALTVRENIQLPMIEHLKLPRDAMDDLARLKLRLVGLPQDAGAKYPAQLSGGMIKRAALARALALDPQLLLLDEPTSGLDPHSRHRMYETIDALRAQGKTVLASTHALAEIESHADEVILIHGGRVLAAGTLTELRGAAALPTMAKVRLRHDAAHSMPCIDANGIEMSRPAPDRLDFHIPAGHLPSFLDILATSRSWIEDIEIEPPTLDRLYQHLLAQAEADQ